MNELYNSSLDFKAYVDKYINKEKVSLQAALSHSIVRSYAQYLAERGNGEMKLPNMWTDLRPGRAHENMADI